MAEITMGRGGQSGGVATFLPTASGGLASVRARVRPGRREAMHTLLAATLRRRLAWASLTHRAPAPSASPARDRLYIGHTRFATSSLPSVGESHPHQWTPPRPTRVWRVVNGAAVSSIETFSLFITHNGDFDFLSLYGRERTHNDVAAWLARVLGAPPPARCDSASVAGCLELYRTQAAWAPSLRLAYQTAVAESFEETFDFQPIGPEAPHAAPSRRVLDALADAADAAFAAFLKGDISGEARGGAVAASASGAAPPDSLPALLAGREAALVDAIAAALASPSCDVDVAARLDASRLRALAAAAVDNFLRADLFSALRRFMSAARGSFGLCVACSLDADRLALAAFNQPMGIAFAPEEGLVLYASEANALAVPIRSASGAPATWRLDIDNVDGEVVELRIAPPPPHGVDAIPTEDALAEAAGSSTSPIAAEAFWPFAAQGCALRLRVHNVRRREGLSLAAFRAAGRLVDMRDNPYIAHDAAGRALTARPGAGRVENDIRDTSRVLAALRDGWAARGSLNGASADALLAQLKARALDAADAAAKGEKGARGGRLGIDVLVTGVETSLWTAEQFASDLQNLFPHLRVVAISANKVIGVLGNARGAISAAGFSFCRLTAKLEHTIAIAVSHSGQTFPTLHATTILQRACPGRVFVVTGAVDTKMAAAVGQSLAKGAPFSARVFSTGAGWRAAEPASVSSLTTHHLLTELLLHLARGMLNDPELAARGVTKPLGLRLDATDVADLTTISEAFVGAAVPCLTGVDARGGDMVTDARAALLKQGRAWGWNVLEAPVVWAFVASYIALAVIFGIPLFRVMLNFAIRSLTGQGIHYDAWRPDFTAPEWSGRVRTYTALYYVAGALDAALFIFLPAMATLALRAAQGRQLLARVKGRRCVVIADVPYVHQMLEVYLSKLFSLSYGIASLDVHGANGTDHFVHRYTHRVARGILLAFGRPDGRLCSQTKCESWVLMSMLQARTIANLGAGPEVVTVGHNPHRTALMDAAIVLPTHRPRLLCESVLEVVDHEPLARMAALSYAVEQGAAPALHAPDGTAADKSHRFAAAPAALSRAREFDAPIGAHLCCEPEAAAAMGAARRFAADLSMRVAEAERAEEAGGGTMHGSVAGNTLHGSSSAAGSGSVHSGIALGGFASGSAAAPPHATPAIGPAGRDAVLSCMGRSVLDLLESQAPLEEFIENRFLSAERYTAFLVMFHEMAATVASFKPLAWDTSRSQSCLRVATTAAPISAADLVRTWQAGTAAGLDDTSYHGGTLSAAAVAAAAAAHAGSGSPRGSEGGGALRRVPSLAIKPGRYRGSFADIVGAAFEGSMHGGAASAGGTPAAGGAGGGGGRIDSSWRSFASLASLAHGGSRASDGGSMQGASVALAAIVGMEEGASGALQRHAAADVPLPWWNAPVVTVASGSVPPERPMQEG
jgi:hypothetical protein